MMCSSPLPLSLTREWHKEKGKDQLENLVAIRFNLEWHFEDHSSTWQHVNTTYNGPLLGRLWTEGGPESWKMQRWEELWEDNTWVFHLLLASSSGYSRGREKEEEQRKWRWMQACYVSSHQGTFLLSHLSQHFFHVYRDIASLRSSNCKFSWWESETESFASMDAIPVRPPH